MSSATCGLWVLHSAEAPEAVLHRLNGVFPQVSIGPLTPVDIPADVWGPSLQAYFSPVAYPKGLCCLSSLWLRCISSVLQEHCFVVVQSTFLCCRVQLISRVSFLSRITDQTGLHIYYCLRWNSEPHASCLSWLELASLKRMSSYLFNKKTCLDVNFIW